VKYCEMAERRGFHIYIVNCRARRWELDLELELGPDCDICLKSLEIFPP
jgi:hypothetical protein